MPRFRIVMGKSGSPHISMERSGQIQKKKTTADKYNFEVPRPISPLPPTPSSSHGSLNTYDVTPSTSTETTCEDEIAMYSDTNEQIISVNSIYGIFK